MSNAVQLTGAEFDAMVLSGAFERISPKKIELVHGELRMMNPAGPIHDDYVVYLTNWSYKTTDRRDFEIRVQSGIVCDDNRPEPDVLWLRPGRYGRKRPSSADVMLLIEVSESSLASDLREKADLYAHAGIVEYWVVDGENQRIHVMTNPREGCYRDIRVVVPPHPLAPLCKPDARLDLADLFSVS
jgi:Uma2 family endonuclease